MKAMSFIKPFYSPVFPSGVHPHHPKAASQLMHSLGPGVLGCWVLWFKCVMACDLDALFQFSILHVLPVVPGVCEFRSLTMSKFLFKILLSVAILGYLFDLTILSTLAHQLGRKAVG